MLKRKSLNHLPMQLAQMWSSMASKAYISHVFIFMHFRSHSILQIKLDFLQRFMLNVSLALNSWTSVEMLTVDFTETSACLLVQVTVPYTRMWLCVVCVLWRLRGGGGSRCLFPPNVFPVLVSLCELKEKQSSMATSMQALRLLPFPELASDTGLVQ